MQEVQLEELVVQDKTTANFQESLANSDLLISLLNLIKFQF